MSDYFYRGPIARELDEWCRANGGLIRYPDLAGHVTRVEEPASIDYRGYIVLEYEEAGNVREECEKYIDKIREAFI